MKYLLPGPMFFGPPRPAKSQPAVVVIGGPSHEIPPEFQCKSGAHDLRLTSCFCTECRGIDLGDGNFSGCSGTGGDCPACGK